METQFSIPWSVATAIAKRRATIQDYTDNAAKDPVIHELTSKIEKIEHLEEMEDVGVLISRLAKG